MLDRLAAAFNINNLVNISAITSEFYVIRPATTWSGGITVIIEINKVQHKLSIIGTDMKKSDAKKSDAKKFPKVTLFTSFKSFLLTLVAPNLWTQVIASFDRHQRVFQ